MRTKEKIMGGAVVLLLAITFLPMQGAYAGVTDYIRNKVNAATSYVTSSPTYKTYVSPTVNRISSNSVVSSLRGQVTNLSNTAGKYRGLGAKSALIRPENGGRALAYIKMESRTEYSMTDTRTNKTIPINESVFRSLVKK